MAAEPHAPPEIAVGGGRARRSLDPWSSPESTSPVHMSSSPSTYSPSYMLTPASSISTPLQDHAYTMQAMQQQQHFESLNAQLAVAAAIKDLSSLMAFQQLGGGGGGGGGGGWGGNGVGGGGGGAGGSGSPQMSGTFAEVLPSAGFGTSGAGSLNQGYGHLQGEMAQMAAAGLPAAAPSSPERPGLTSALAQAAAERGLDGGALAMLLQSPIILDLLAASSPAPQTPQSSPPSPPPPSPPHHRGGRNNNNLRRLSPDPARRSGGAAAGGGGAQGGGGSPVSCPSLSYTPSSPPAAYGSGGLSLYAQPFSPLAVPASPSPQVTAEFNSLRLVLVQLMLSAFAFLTSDNILGFYESLAPLSRVYSSMHELPVVMKRSKCLEMAVLRTGLMQDASFVQILQAVCALRHHLYSLSRKVLLLSQQGMEAMPMDLLLSCMPSELHTVLKGVLPQDVLEFFSNQLPHPRLALLVFAEFTGVDSAPVLL